MYLKHGLRVLLFVGALFVALIMMGRRADALDDAPAAEEQSAGEGGSGAPPVADHAPVSVPVLQPQPQAAPEVAPSSSEPSVAALTAPAGPAADVLGSVAAPLTGTLAPSTQGEGETYEQNDQQAHVENTGTSSANTGSNTTAGGAVGGGSTSTSTDPATPGGAGSGQAGSTARVDTGGAGAQGSVDQSTIGQQVELQVTDDARIEVLQVALVVNIGIGIGNSGSNTAVARTNPHVAAVLRAGRGSTAGALTGSGAVNTGGAYSTGNAGSTQVIQTIVLVGRDVDRQLATVINSGVGVSNSGLNFAVGAVAGGGAPSGGAPATFVFLGQPSTSATVGTGTANALGNRANNTILQVVFATASGEGVLSVSQRAIIVNFGLAIANSGFNNAAALIGGGGIPGLQELLMALLGPDAGGVATLGPTTADASISAGRANAIGNDTVTGITQQFRGSVSGSDVGSSSQDAFVGNFGIALANSGANGAGAFVGMDPAAFAMAQTTVQAFLQGLWGLGAPVQDLDATFKLGQSLLSLHGDIDAVETLLGVSEGTSGGSGGGIFLRQITGVLNIGLAFSDSGNNEAVSVSVVGDTDAVDTQGAATEVLALESRARIVTGDATSVGSRFAVTICQAINDSLACAAPTQPPEGPGPEGEPENPTSPPETPPAGEAPRGRSPELRRAPAPAALPFTGVGGIQQEAAAGLGLAITGLLLRRKARKA